MAQLCRARKAAGLGKDQKILEPFMLQLAPSLALNLRHHARPARALPVGDLQAGVIQIKARAPVCGQDVGRCGDDKGECMKQRGRMAKSLRKAAQGIGVLAGGVAVFLLAMRASFPLPDQAAAAKTPDLASLSSDLATRLAPHIALHPGLSGVVTLQNGADAFAARIHLARAATVSIDAQYYIWNDITSGTTI